MFNTVYTSVIPLVEKKYSQKVQIIFRQQVQPWHPSSTLVHEAGVAVLKTDPDKFWVNVMIRITLARLIYLVALLESIVRRANRLF